ncbi:MAG: glycosyltransferase [Pseudomonadota bacterium]
MDQPNKDEAGSSRATASADLLLTKLRHAPNVLRLIEQAFPDLQFDPLPMDDDDRPFLSVVTRTQGRRTDMLRDTILSLAAQSDPDFELLLVGHKIDERSRTALEQLVAEFPKVMQDKIRILICDRDGRAAPLNNALAAAKGRYISVLDDDDFVMGHWVEVYHQLAKENVGSVLRAACTRQDYQIPDPKHPTPHPMASSWFQMIWPSGYSGFNHVYENKTPFMSVALPRDGLIEMGLQFDESLSTVEDWDLTTRAAMACGVASSPEITSVYRWWTDGESSSFVHKEAEWKANHNKVLSKSNKRYLVLPPGAAQEISDLYDENAKLRSGVGSLGVWELVRKTVKARTLKFIIHHCRKTAAGRWILRTGQRALLRRDHKLIEKSGLFNADWYLANYPDVADAGLDAWDHFRRNGLIENRNPGPDFNADYYITQYSDVAVSGLKPLMHFVRYGLAEGRNGVRAREERNES